MRFHIFLIMILLPYIFAVHADNGTVVAALDRISMVRMIDDYPRILDRNSMVRMIPNTITVGPSGADYSSIQAAIDAANPGDTIEVGGGVYHEQLYITKTIKLRGAKVNEDMPIIDAGGKYSSNSGGLSVAISAFAEGTIIEGLKVSNAFYGIIINSNNTIIKNNTIEDNVVGIFIKEAKRNNALNNNYIKNNSLYGMEIYGSSNIINNNEILENDLGIILSFTGSGTDSYYNKISNNNIYKNEDGIILGSKAKKNYIINNSIYENGNWGIRIDDSDNSLFGNYILKNQINLIIAEGNQIDYSNLIDDKHALYLKDVSDKIVDQTLNLGIVNCRNCSNITIRNLDLRNDTEGIYLYNTTNSIIINNSLLYNDDGILLVSSNDNTIIGNDISNNGVGIELIDSSNDTIRLNKIDNNHIGIYLRGYSENNVMESNVFELNGGDSEFFSEYDIAMDHDCIWINQLDDSAHTIGYYSIWDYLCAARPDHVVTVKSDPPGAEVWLDGRKTKYLTDKEKNVELHFPDSKNHTIKLRLDKYEVYLENISIPQTNEVNAILKGE